MEKILPAMPPSDNISLSVNRYDGVNRVRARDFWGDNEVVNEEVAPFKKCEHTFSYKNRGVECQKCHFGLLGPLEIQNGELFFRGEPIRI